MVLVLLEDDFELMYNKRLSLVCFQFPFSRLLYLIMQEGVKIKAA